MFPDSTDSTIVNYINEIPKNSCEKMEIATKEKDNPIKQDEKKGKLRFYPFASLVNYGCLPQTWEDPSKTSLGLEYLGDNDPLDVVELSSIISPTGSVYKVKILGSLGMIDEGEMDWKIIAININDPISAQINNITDVNKHFPGKIDDIIAWFKFYKVPDGKPVNFFEFEEKPLTQNKSVEIIKECHDSWKAQSELKKNGLWC